MAQVQLMNVETPTQNPFGNWNKIHGFDRIFGDEDLMIFGDDVSIASFITVGERVWGEPS